MVLDPQGYPVQEYTNLRGDVVLQVFSDGTIVLNTGVTVSSGAGSPEGVKIAPVGSLYIDKNGTTPNILYQKQTGAGNTGWVAIGGGGGGGGVTSVFGRSGVVVADPNDYASVDDVIVGDSVGNQLKVDSGINTIDLTSTSILSLVGAGGVLFIGDGVSSNFRLANADDSVTVRSDSGTDLLLTGATSCSLGFTADTVTLQCASAFLKLGVGGTAFDLRGQSGGGAADIQSPDGDQLTIAGSFIFLTAPTVQMQGGLTAAFGLADTGFSINDGNINSINSNASTNTVSMLSANGGALTVSTIIEANTLIKTTTLSVNTPAPAAGVTEVAFGNGHATTVGAAGGADPVPATPTGYLIINVNGTDQKIPYFDV
jgi:hypothetical protein